jgi:NADPH2 dehydrogenase
MSFLFLFKEPYWGYDLFKVVMIKTRFTQYLFKNKKTASNRVVVPPMASQTADSQGFVTEQTIEHYRRLAQSGVGILFVEYSYVHVTGKGEVNQLAVNCDDKIPGLSRIAKMIHDSGALAGLQIVHAGGKTTSEITGSPLMGPSAISVPVKGWTPPTAIALNDGQIEQLTQWYVDAARRALAAGFDIVELHAAHGYGLNQWLSPITNLRLDRYGKNKEGRSTLLLEVASQIKELFPELLLAVRLPAQDFMPHGLTVEEMGWVAQKLEEVGMDLLDVSSGIGGWKRPEGRQGQGYLVGDAAALKKSVSVPVIGVGGIESGCFIDEILSTSQVDFAAVGRALLRDPQAWHANC